MASRSTTSARATAARPRTAPATATPTPPLTSSARGSGTPWPGPASRRANRSRTWSDACSGRPPAWASGPGCSSWIAASTAWRWSATSRRRHRQLRLPDLEDKRLVPLPLGRREEAHRDGVDLCEVPPLPRGAEAPRTAGVDLCLLGLSTALAGCGVHDVPAAVRDRVELPPDARGTDSNDDAASGGAVVVRGDRVGASEPLGVAALYDPLDAASRGSGDPVGAVAVGDALALVTPRGRGDVRSDRRHLHRTGCPI